MAKRLITLFVLAALLLTGAVGCRAKSAENNGTESPTGGAVPTATAEVTPTADATTGAATAGASGAASAADTAAIRKELDAIQKELDGMSLPGDSDFDSIESDIP